MTAHGVRLSGALLFALALGGCGAAPASLSVSVPWLLEQELSCPNQADGLAGLQATLHVSGGNPSCPLQVAADLSVTGRCAGYVPQAEQTFLLIAYTLPLPGPPAEQVALAYALTSADLRPGSLPTGEEVAVRRVTFKRDDLIITQDELDAWGRVVNFDCRASLPETLDGRARRWAWCHIQTALGGAGLACTDASTPLLRACSGDPFTGCYGD